jgi:hypothetical protein
MNRRNILATALAVLVTLTIGARLSGAQDVTVNFAPNVDLSNYRGYEWVKIDGANYPKDPLILRSRTRSRRCWHPTGCTGSGTTTLIN